MFANNKLFAGMSSGEIDQIISYAQLCTRNKGETVFSEGDPSDGIYLIERGSVVISLKGNPVAYLNAGELFGEISLLDETRSIGKRSASAQADTDVQLLHIPDILQVSNQGLLIKLYRNFSRILAERLADTTRASVMRFVS